MKVTDKYVLFWGSVFSNFAPFDKPFKFKVKGKEYKAFTSEQLFMMQKAILFKDLDMLDTMNNVVVPAEVKDLGRKVSNFDTDIWDEYKCTCMLFAVKIKLFYCKEFNDEVFNPLYKDLSFVEASPIDKIWGIGLDEDNPAAWNMLTWQGQNLLGKTLDKLRADAPYDQKDVEEFFQWHLGSMLIGSSNLPLPTMFSIKF